MLGFARYGNGRAQLCSTARRIALVKFDVLRQQGIICKIMAYFQPAETSNGNPVLQLRFFDFPRHSKFFQQISALRQKQWLTRRLKKHSLFIKSYSTINAVERLLTNRL